MAIQPFQDRFDAGKRLAAALAKYAGRPDVLVLALPRGGVPVGFEVARALRAPLDVFIVRKLGVPGQEELAMGALATGGVVVLNREVVSGLGIPGEVVNQVAEREREELERREHAYRDDRPPLRVAGKSAILVDDGLATGSTMRAAVAALRRQGPARIVVGVPVAASEICELFAREVGEAVCLITPPQFYAVGMWYQDFSQTTDEEVRDLLRQAATAQPGV